MQNEKEKHNIMNERVVMYKNGSVQYERRRTEDELSLQSMGCLWLPKAEATIAFWR